MFEEIRLANAQEDAVAVKPPAIYTNAYFVTRNADGVRLTFGEILGTHVEARGAIFISCENAKIVAALLASATGTPGETATPRKAN